MAAQAWFSDGDVTVAPGSSVVLHLTVANLADTTDSFVITPAGLAAAWTTITPSTITLFGGTQQDVEVRVTPPLLPGTSSGNTSLTVRIVPNSDPDEVRTVDVVIAVGTVVDRHVEVLQPAQRSRRTATYEMMLENRGNSQATCRMYLVDPTGRLEADFDPPSAGAEPGTSTLVRARVQATRLQWERRPRTITFRVDAAEAGCPTASATATFVQEPVLPQRLVGRAVAIAAALVLIAIAWFTVVRPAVQDAARDAVRGDSPVTTSVIDDVTGSVVTVVVTTTPQDEQGNGGDKGDDGTIANIALPVSVAVGETGAIDFTVPAGQRLQVTDIVVQNPNGDQGTLLVQRDDVTLYLFRLDNIIGDTSVPLVTPIEFRAGQRLVVTVTCAAVGDPTIASCAQNVFASGVLLDE
jgi:hypothetical protein